MCYGCSSPYHSYRQRGTVAAASGPSLRQVVRDWAGVSIRVADGSAAEQVADLPRAEVTWCGCSLGSGCSCCELLCVPKVGWERVGRKFLLVWGIQVYERTVTKESHVFAPAPQT